MSVVEISQKGETRYWLVWKSLAGVLRFLAGSIKGNKPGDEVIVDAAQGLVAKVTGDKEGYGSANAAKVRIISETTFDKMD